MAEIKIHEEVRRATTSAPLVICERDHLKVENITLREAAMKLIEMNQQQAENQYGAPDKAGGWSCASILRAALSGVATPSAHNENVPRHKGRHT